MLLRNMDPRIMGLDMPWCYGRRMDIHWPAAPGLSMLLPSQGSARVHEAYRRYGTRRHERQVFLGAGDPLMLVERKTGVDECASTANGGQLICRYAFPLADEGVPPMALRWLRDWDGHLRFRPGADWHQCRWLLNFLFNCRGHVDCLTTRSLPALVETAERWHADSEFSRCHFPGVL